MGEQQFFFMINDFIGRVDAFCDSVERGTDLEEQDCRIYELAKFLQENLENQCSNFQSSDTGPTI